MTRITPALAGPRRRSSGRARRRRPGWCASSSWRPRSRHASRRIMPERPTAGGRRVGAAGEGGRRRRRGPAARSARARAGRPSGGARAARPARSGVASGVSRRAAATSRTTYGCAGQPPVRVEDRDRVELAAGGADRPLEVRRLGVEDPVEVAAQRARHLARLELEQRPAGADPAQERPDRLAALPGHDAAAAPQPPRRRQADLGEPRRRGPAPRRAATTNSRWVRPPARLSEPRARNRPRSQAVRQWSAARRPVERARSTLVVAARAGGRRAGPPTPRGPRRRAVAPSPEADRLGDAVARPRRVDRGQLGPQRRDEVALASGSRQARPRRGPRRRSGAATPASRSSARRSAAARRAGSWWWALSGSTTSSRTSRGTGSTAGGQRRRTGCGRPVVGRPGASNVVVGEDDVDDARARCARRAPRRARPGRTRSVSPSWVATLQTKTRGALAREDGVADRRDQQARQEARVQAARAEHDQVGLGDRRERVLGRLRRRRA